MGLVNFFKPKWKSMDADDRLAEVKKMGPDDIETLASIAAEEQTPEIRKAAIDKVSDEGVLQEIAERVDPDFKDDVLSRIASLRTNKIIQAARHDDISDTLRLIDDPNKLAIIAAQAESSEIRLAAVNSINDEAILAGICESKCGKATAAAALEKITDPILLKRLTSTASNKSTRAKAAAKIAEQETLNTPRDPRELRDQEIQSILKQAEALALSYDWDSGEASFLVLRNKWKLVDPDETHPLKSEFEKAWDRFKTRQEKFQLKRDEEQHKAEEFSAFITQCEEICAEIEKLIGSTEDNAEFRFKDFFNKWPEENALFRIEPLAGLSKRFHTACKHFHEAHAQVVKEKTLFGHLVSACSELENKSKDIDLELFENKIKAIEEDLEKTAFRFYKINKITSRLEAIKQSFDERIKDKLNLLAARHHENIEKRKSIISEIQSLIKSDNRAIAEKRIKDLQRNWKTLKRLSNDEQPFFESYDQALKDFFASQRDFYAQKEWLYWANKTIKEDLCAEAEALDGEEDLAIVAEKVKELQAKWKEIGPAPKNVSEELWQRFHETCQRNFDRCKPYFDKRNELRNERVTQKEKICEIAEVLSQSDEWKITADELKRLQKEWLHIGDIPRRKEEKLYRRFRHACNAFFERRRIHYNKLDGLRKDNLLEKEKLCEQAENMAKEPQMDHAGKLKSLQAQWRKIGPVPNEHSDVIWKRFRAACDMFFSWRDAQWNDNLKKKEELCDQVEQYLASLDDEVDSAAEEETLEGFRKQWQEIGPVPADKKDAIYNRFHNPFKHLKNAKKDHARRADRERRERIRRKQELLRQAEQLAFADNAAESIEAVQKLQEQWQEIGSGSKEMETELNREFETICNAIIEGQVDTIEKIQQIRLDNLKKKEALCFQMEQILGIHGPTVDGSNESSALSLAEEFKLAMEANFMMAGQRNDQRRIKDEVHRIRKEWKTMGTIQTEQDEVLEKRFQSALDVFFKNTRKKE